MGRDSRLYKSMYLGGLMIMTKKDFYLTEKRSSPNKANIRIQGASRFLSQSTSTMTPGPLSSSSSLVAFFGYWPPNRKEGKRAGICCDDVSSRHQPIIICRARAVRHSNTCTCAKNAPTTLLTLYFGAGGSPDLLQRRWERAQLASHANCKFGRR